MSDPSPTPELSIRDAELFRRHVTLGVDVSDAEWSWFAAQARRLRFEPADVLVLAGCVCSTLYFLWEGLVRIRGGVDGRESTLGFEREGRFVVDYESFATQRPARTTIDALEPCIAIAVERDVLESSYDRAPCWDRVGRLHAEHGFRRKIDKELRTRSMTPEERYRALLRDNSPLLERVPQYHLARYLGITPETLSRIRARLHRSDGS